MTDLDLARQLVAYVDATTSPVAPEIDHPTEVVVLAPPPGRPRDRRWIVLAAAAAALALVGALVLAGVRDDGAIDELDDPVPTTVPDPRHAAAIDAATRYFEAWSTNDADTVVELGEQVAIIPTAERNAVRWWYTAAWPDGDRRPWPSEPCRVAPAGRDGFDSIRVDCPIEIGDPVARALGLTEMTWSAEVGDDGSVFRGAMPIAANLQTFDVVWRTYGDYLEEFRPDERDCAGDDRPTGSVYVEGGLALDGRCAQVVAAIADEVALWVELGDVAPALGGEALIGVWENTAGFEGLVVEFRRDGTFGIGNTGRLDDAGVFTFGTFEVVGSTVEFDVDDAAAECRGETWEWIVAIPFDGLLEATVLGNGGCTTTAAWQLTRLSPASPAGLAIRAHDDRAVAGSDPAELIPGVWHLVGTGELLEVRPDGTYVLTASGSDDAVDRGTLAVDPAGTWRLSSDGSAACTAQETWTWSDVTVAVGALDRGNPGDVVLRAPTTARCGGDDSPGEWRRIAPGTG